jgi:uncharacterized membrane protein YphA (DoxX/SURF4 family)
MELAGALHISDERKTHRPELLLNSFGLSLSFLATYSVIAYKLLILSALFPAHIGFQFPESVYHGVLIGCAVVFVGTGAAGVLGKLKWLDNPSLLYWQQTALRYILASIFISYGFAKIFHEQFYTLRSTLDTPLGDITGIQLAWRFFGYSYAYTLFVASAQIFGSFLLFFRRFVTLGALILLPVISNIVFINFSHEIPVKEFSILLLVMTAYLLALDYRRLRALFIEDAFVIGERRTPASAFGGGRLRAVMKWLVIVLIFGSHMGASYHFYLEANKRGAFTGVWEVEEYRVNGVARRRSETSDVWEKVYFEPGDVLAVKTAAPRPAFFLSQVDEKARTIRLEDWKSGDELKCAYELPSDDKMLVKTTKGADSIEVFLKKSPE